MRADGTGPAVTIAIPAYQAAGTIAPAVESALEQTYQPIEVIVSIDQSNDATEDICRSYRDDCLTIAVQTERLGWEGNVNALLERIRTPYFVLLFHDDRLHPKFCDTLVSHMERDRSIVAATGAVTFEGGLSKRKAWSSVTGSRFERLFTVLTTPQDLYPHMCLTRSDLVLPGLRVVRVGPHGYRSDMLYLMELSLAGTFKAVPEVLYFKYFGDDTVSGGWRRLGPDVVFASEVELRAAQIALVAATDLAADEKQRLIEAILSRAEPMVTPETNADGQAFERHQRLTAAVVARLMTDAPVREPYTSGPDRRFRASQQLRLAEYALKRGFVDVARVYAIQASALDGGSIAAHLVTARTLLHSDVSIETSTRALQHADAAIALDETSVPAWRLRARALVHLDRRAEAKLARERAAALEEMLRPLGQRSAHSRNTCLVGGEDT